MENCSLSITLPSFDDTAGQITDEPAVIEVWSLPVKGKLDMQKLSYATRPTGGTFFGSLPVSFGETHRLPGYRCLSGSYQSFEFKLANCSKPGCKIDVMGNGDQASGLSFFLPWTLPLNIETLPGVYMYQYQTV